MKEVLLNFDQGFLLILKLEIGKDGIVNEELIKEWSENVTIQQRWMVQWKKRRLYNRACFRQCVLEN